MNEIYNTLKRQLQRYPYSILIKHYTQVTQFSIYFQLLLTAYSIFYALICTKYLNCFLFKRLTYSYANRLLLWAQTCDATGCFDKALHGTNYRVRQTVHKTTRTDINSRTLQAAVIVLIARFLQFKVNKKQKQ